jgi:death-on-curing protein
VTCYLTLAEVVAMHTDLIERYGGAPGLRDLGLLDAALYRPQSGYYQDIVEEAAALWESLDQNHPFIDGNKRSAFAATHAFLFVNGLTLVAEPLQTFAFMADLRASGEFDLAHLDVWLREHTRG